MSNGNVASSSGQHVRMHSEVRSPIETILSRIIEYVSGVIVAIIAFRFVLLLFGANAQAGFVRFIYGLSGVFMAPFNLIFSTQRVAGATFEWSALVAMAVYALLAWGLVALIRAVSPREHAETVETEKDVDSGTTRTQ